MIIKLQNAYRIKKNYRSVYYIFFYINTSEMEIIAGDNNLRKHPIFTVKNKQRKILLAIHYQ